LAAYGAYSIRAAAGMSNPANEWSGWIAGLAGLWILVSPFVLGGGIATSPMQWSNVAAGVVTLVLAAYAGHGVHAGE
jgi:hypothetical protein